jgi:CheY-like chemotaxis protein
LAVAFEESTKLEEPKRVLAAEDNLAMAGVIRFNLEKAGFDVTVAKTGTKAWELLNTFRFDAVVSDFQMPGMTGGELCERIRRTPRLANLPVVLLTAKELELDTDHYLQELSVSAIMSKPFSPRELAQTVQNCLSAGVST